MNMTDETAPMGTVNNSLCEELHEYSYAYSLDISVDKDNALQAKATAARKYLFYYSKNVYIYI